MKSSKRYNSVPVKENWALFARTSLFLGPGFPTVLFKFVPWRPLLPWQLTVLIQRQNWLQQTSFDVGLLSVKIGLTHSPVGEFKNQESVVNFEQ